MLSEPDLQHINVVVCDDEMAGITVITHLLKQLGFSNIQCFQDPVLALRCVTSSRVDLLFVDINMPNLDGLSLARQVDSLATELVFVTAYAENALASYHVEALDFLTKPVSPQRFKITMDRFLRKLGKGEKTIDKNPSEYLLVNEASQQRSIPVNNIKSIQSADKYVVIHCLNENIVWRKGLNQVIAMLPDEFVRIHRGTVINKSWLDKTCFMDGRWWAFMLDGQKIAIGKTYKDKLKSSN